VTTQTVLDQLCQYLGGPYDAAQHIYHQNPQLVTGVYTVKRAWWKQEDNAAYLLDATPGTRSGCALIVQIEDGDEKRVAVAGAVSGVKKASHAVTLNLASSGPPSRTPRTPRTSVRPAGRDHRPDPHRPHLRLRRLRGRRLPGRRRRRPWIRWHMARSHTRAELTLIYLSIEFEAHEYLQA
jgi:hypothetical protein